MWIGLIADLGRVGFFQELGQKYYLDFQDFLHEKLPKLLGVAILAWILLHLLNLVTGHVLKIANRQASTAGHFAQVKTLTSVIRATGIAVIAILAALQILPILGFNLGPLLTSAGVAGVAIGLAAQNIVKDCFNGFLILVEDQYNVGDLITVAGVTGKVEAMSLRKTQVRGSDGTLYIVPNSQITTVANQMRDFSLATINVSVDFSANPDEVMTLLRDAAMSVRNDPQYSDVYLADPTLLGVDAIKGSQVIYPVQLRTKANQQWTAMRETQRRIRLALEEHGMLPGDPLRVYHHGGQPSGTAVQEETPPRVDPTLARAAEGNPLTGGGT
jgi:small-conductance mechanosensitive channel